MRVLGEGSKQETRKFGGEKIEFKEHNALRQRKCTYAKSTSNGYAHVPPPGNRPFRRQLRKNKPASSASFTATSLEQASSTPPANTKPSRIAAAALDLLSNS